MPGVISGVISLRRARRSLRIGSLAVLPFAVLGATLFREASHARPAAPLLSRLAPAPLPAAGERVLVFSPHPDDETLGAGGLIADARRRGAEVQVVFVTSGDGFPLCAAREFRRWPGPAAMARLAARRRQEALAATARLGVPPQHVVFLGYPDRGLSRLWTDHWLGAPRYVSPYTGRASVPPQGTFRPGAPYRGLSLLEDVEQLLGRSRPHLVLYPDPADDHPDHWATHCFVRMALERLREEPWAEDLRARTFLVHRGSWPQPLAEGPGLPLHPPRALDGLGARWERVDLSPEAASDKREALRAYASQQAVAGSFLAAFVRRNELLAEWPSRGLPASGVTVLPDSTRDRFGRARWRGADVAALEAGAGPGGLRLRARLRGPVAALPVYHLYWKPLDGPPASAWTRSYRVSGYACQPAGARFSIRGSEIEVRVPPEELRDTDRVLVAADVWSGPLLLDRTPWRVLRLGDRIAHP